MKEIVPAKSLEGAAELLDNGGRFYNFLTDAGDDEVTSAELAKAAGVFRAGPDAFLFLDMVLAELEEDEALKVRGLLSEDLAQRGVAYRPLACLPSKVELLGAVGKTAVVSGYARLADRKAITSVMLMPMHMNGMTTFMVIPLTDRFDIYEVFDTPKFEGKRALIAHVRGQPPLGEERMTFGGYLRERKEGAKAAGLFLEARFFSR
jgi:hypothetical protein